MTNSNIPPSPQAGTPQSPDAPANPSSPVAFQSFEDVQKAIKQLSDDVRKLGSPRTRLDRLIDFAIGLFFMVVGAGFLFFAKETMHTQHAALSFVFVVLGVAMLLFGTGTQGSGNLDGTGYKIAIWGGAGAIAFAVGWGMLKYSSDIRTVFQIERKYVRVTLEGKDGKEYVADYIASVKLRGAGIPVARHSDSLEILVPYDDREWDTREVQHNRSFVHSLSSDFVRCDAPSDSVISGKDDFITRTFEADLRLADRSKERLKEKVTGSITVTLRKSHLTDLNRSDLPGYRDRVCVELLSRTDEAHIRKNQTDSTSKSVMPQAVQREQNLSIDTPTEIPPVPSPADAAQDSSQ